MVKGKEFPIEIFKPVPPDSVHSVGRASTAPQLNQRHALIRLDVFVGRDQELASLVKALKSVVGTSISNPSFESRKEKGRRE